MIFPMSGSTLLESLIFVAVWEEAFKNGEGQLSSNAIVHVWKKEHWQETINNVTTQLHFFCENTYLKKNSVGHQGRYACFTFISVVP
jgi:hypothetical protein